MNISIKRLLCLAASGVAFPPQPGCWAWPTFSPIDPRVDTTSIGASLLASAPPDLREHSRDDLAAAMIEGEPKVEHAFRTGGGVRWGDSAGCLFCATGAFFRPGYVNNIVQTWLPALQGIEEKLASGARVADVGCGVGFSTILMAKAYPNATFVGYDFHEPSIGEAESHARTHGVDDRVKFVAATAKEIKDTGFDLVTSFDCLHDMGDPRGCADHMRRILKKDGSWMIVEPIAGDRPEENMNPVGRLYYKASTMICVPTSLDQEVGEGLGAQAGEAKLSEVIRSGGFTQVRRVVTGPFNMVLEARLSS